MPRVRLAALESDLLLKGVWEGLGTPECLVTGGYVRDRLLGRKTVDLDLVIPGGLEKARGPAQRLAARLDGRAHILGRDDKRVWRIETSQLKVELWPLGGLDLHSDIRRRDFSCNALMWRLPDGPLIDRVGGLADIKRASLRAVMKKNLAEDPVRLVRAARFLAQFPSFNLEPRTTGWIRSLAPKVRRAPPERLGQELLRLATETDPVRGLQALDDLGMLHRMAGMSRRSHASWAAANLEAASRLRPNSHPLRAALVAAGDTAVLALLLRAWEAPHPDEVAHFAWPRPIRLRAATAARLLDSALETVDGPADDRRILAHAAGSAFPTLVTVAAAVEPDHHWQRWWRQWRTRDPLLGEPLLSGDEVAHLLGYEPGPALGRAVNALLDAQVRDEVRTRGGAERWLRRWFAVSSPRLWEG